MPEWRSCRREPLEVPVEKRPIEGNGVGDKHRAMTRADLRDPCGRVSHGLRGVGALAFEPLPIESVDGERLLLELGGDWPQLSIERLLTRRSALEAGAVVAPDDCQPKRQQ